VWVWRKCVYLACVSVVVFTILLAVTFHFVSFNVLRFFSAHFALNCCWPIQGDFYLQFLVNEKNIEGLFRGR